MERPVDLKPGKAKPRKGATVKDERICIVHFASTTEKLTKPFTEQGFEKIKDVARLRLSHADAKHHLEHISKNLPESLDLARHGSHRRCYQLYTNVSRLTKRPRSDNACMFPSETQPSTSKSRRTSSISGTGPLFPSDKCLFCNKQSVKIKGKRQNLIKCVT